MRRAGSVLLALLLTAGWGEAQTAAPQPSPAQSAAVSPTTPPDLSASPDPAQAASSPVNALISALKRSWLAEARGEAVLELVFPPSGTPLRRAHALPRLAAVPALIRRNFVVTVSAPELAAGRPALRYTLTPRNEQAARWTVWIDQKWKVPLAYQERMPGGSLARRAELTSVNPALARLTVAAPTAPLAGSPALKKALLSALPGLKLPAGFEPLSVQLRTGAAGNTSTEVLLTDGLNLLALVVSPRPVQAASGVAVRRLKGQSVWLVGNLPQNTLEDALSSIRSLNAQAVSSLPGTSGLPAASDQ